MKLFDDDADDVSKIEINPEFAKRYEHNKKREDLHKYEEMKKKGLIESGSESVSESDSDGADDIVDGKFIDRLLKIRKKDPNLLQKESKLFDSSDDDDEDEEKEAAAKKAKKAKPKYLKDLNAENLIENGAEFDEDEEEEKERKKVKSFVEEQEDLRKSVLAAMAEEEEQRLIGDDDDDDGLLTVKERDVVEEDEVDGEMNEKLDEFFGEDEKLDENDKFLKEFFRNKMWIDKGQGLGGGGGGGGGEGEIELSDDEEAVLRQEEYERDFNFRFEESKSDRVLGHSRVVVDSVRNDKNTRKLQRERKKDKERLAKIEMDEEVKRLKNLKRAEIRDRLRKIREIAGVVDQDQDQGGIPLDEDYLEKDFDPKEFDETMKVAFGDDYYQADDDHFKPVFGSDDDLEKPDFGKEDELLGLPKDWDVIKSKDGFLAKRGKKDKKEIIVDDDEEEEELEEKVEDGKRKRKRKSKIGEALKKELEEELYKYDYEDAIGDLKTRFKYRKVKPNKYKLSAAEVLWYDEQELNQYVSLKKLAPYREQEWEVRGDRKNMLNVGILSGKNMNEKKGKMDGGEGSSKTIDEEQSNKDETKQSRGAKRRENMKKKQLSVSRLVAYGKNPSSSSKKKLN